MLGRADGPMRTLKRFGIAVAVLLLAGYVGAGVYQSRYSPERSSRYLWAAYHVHSTLSDGFLPPEEIARQARAAGISLIVLTDHGNPNYRAASYRKVVDGVTIAGGSEATLPEGHLTFFGVQTVPLFKLPSFPPAALADVREWGGFGIMAYPEDPRQGWKYQEPDFIPDGIEIGNLFTCALRLSAFERLWLLLEYPFSNYYFLKYIFFPAESMATWDRMLEREKVWGMIAVDAHGGIRLEKHLALPIPSYMDSFSLAALGIDRRHSSAPEEAIRHGNFFNCLRGAGEPQRFEFSGSRGAEQFPSGSSPAAPADLHIRVETQKLKVRLVLKKDGATIRQASGGTMDFLQAPAGVYRAEVYLAGHPLLPPNVPWILSNPIFVGREPGRALPAAATAAEPMLRLNLAEFHVEKDAKSSAGFETSDGGGRFSYHLEGDSEVGVARWCALVRRKPSDLSGTHGFYIRAFSDQYLRYLIELRSGDRWYYASFKVYPGKETLCQVPYNHFYRVGDERESPPLRSIDTVAIDMNEFSARTGFSATLEIREMGFY